LKIYFIRIIVLILFLVNFIPILTYGQETACQSLTSNNIFVVPNGTYGGLPYYTENASNPKFLPPAGNCYSFAPNNTCWQISMASGSTRAAGRLVQLYGCPIDDWLIFLIIPVAGFSIYSMRSKFRIII
jgi:hypothetical protein